MLLELLLSPRSLWLGALSLWALSTGLSLAPGAFLDSISDPVSLDSEALGEDLEEAFLVVFFLVVFLVVLESASATSLDLLM